MPSNGLRIFLYPKINNYLLQEIVEKQMAKILTRRVTYVSNLLVKFQEISLANQMHIYPQVPFQPLIWLVTSLV